MFFVGVRKDTVFPQSLWNTGKNDKITTWRSSHKMKWFLDFSQEKCTQISVGDGFALALTVSGKVFEIGKKLSEVMTTTVILPNDLGHDYEAILVEACGSVAWLESGSMSTKSIEVLKSTFYQSFFIGTMSMAKSRFIPKARIRTLLEPAKKSPLGNKYLISMIANSLLWVQILESALSMTIPYTLGEWTEMGIWGLVIAKIVTSQRK